VNYWLLKSEPDVFSITDLKKRPGQTEPWDGIRNYQARNFIRDDMRSGDLAFFYHSNCDVPGIAGILKVASAARPDPTAFDQNHIHFDPKSKSDSPAWYLVEVKFVKQFKRIISLNELRQHKALSNMRLLQKGNRLSVMPVTASEWQYILKLE
jgi:predicted RNA-binding protein with PUA-like domain